MGIQRERIFLKRCISIILTVFLLTACVIAGSPAAHAAKKAGASRAIAIVFDNSGSMYDNGDQAWCRATYAMEVFSSMLNKGDTLLIYPMHPITVGGKEYTMEEPFRVSDASQAATIRDIYTPRAVGTPIESVDCAVQGLQETTADKKYMIVLTDGEAFYRNGAEMSISETRRQLDSRFQAQAGNTMTVMYLGIGGNVVMPATEQSEYFVKRQAKNSEDVLSALTDMCNQIFGRDTLPKNHISGKELEFDISMSKLIVFVQGENVSNVTLSGDSGSVGAPLSTAFTKYGTAGCGNYTSTPDTTLQGMMVTYEDCPAGSYTLDYTGTATSIEVYYEPDADLDFVFTDAAGNTVDPNALYEGDYKVSFGMKDARTGQLISSDLLGNPHYQGSYSINGTEYPITHDGHSGEVAMSLSMDDTFAAKLTATYLSGYTISKDSSDFNWPNGGIQVAARPAGDLRLEISGGQELYSLQDLEESEPFTAKLYYQGTQLTGKELKSVELEWEPETSNVEITKEFADDHYKLWLEYKDPEAPQDTVCGPCTVTIYGRYTAKGSSEAQTQTPLTYNIEDDFSPLQMELYAPEDYIVISELEDSEAIVVRLRLNDAPLSARDFAAVALQVDCSGIEYTVTQREQDSSYLIKLMPTDGIEEGDYPVRVTAQYTDHIGRTTQTDDLVRITLSNIPLWIKWAVGILLLILLITLILLILHIKVLPKQVHVNKKTSTVTFDGEDVAKNTAFLPNLQKRGFTHQIKYGGTKTGITMSVKPGRESYLRKSQARRSIEVQSLSVKKIGSPVIQEATIAGVKYVLNEDTNKLERVPKNDKPFVIRHGAAVNYTGTMLVGGVPKSFTVNTKLNFKKK